jgi:thioesterase domain-containing protein
MDEAAEKLTDFLKENISLTQNMSVWVSELSDTSIKVNAPLEPNKNHRGCAFGGSISTLGIISGWALLYHLCLKNKIDCVLVIKKSSTKFIKPLLDDFEASCSITEFVFEEFLKDLRENNKAKIDICSGIYSNNELAAEFSGIYVGVKKK